MTGYYCNRSMTQEPCPAGYFCPNGSALPIKCPKGHYCDPRNHCYDNSSKIDAGACYPRICPLGEFDVFSYQKVIVLQFLPLRSSWYDVISFLLWQGSRSTTAFRNFAFTGFLYAFIIGQRLISLFFFLIYVLEQEWLLLFTL